MTWWHRLWSPFARFIHLNHKENPMPFLEDVAKDIENRFAFHPPTSTNVGDAHSKVRSILATAASDALAVADVVAPGPTRELSLAVTALDEAMMWLNAHIARHQTAPATPPPVLPAVTTQAAAGVVQTAPVAEAVPDVPVAPELPPVEAASIPVTPAPEAPDPGPDANVAPPAPAEAPAPVEPSLDTVAQPSAPAAPVADPAPPVDPTTASAS
jgi:hypothetical protein